MLELEYKKRSDNVNLTMKEAVNSDYDYYDDAVDKIKELLPSPEAHILNSANSCVLTVTEALPEPILIPDEGGWNGLERFSEILNKKVKKIPTDDGIINIENLTNYFEENEINSMYITSLAGYTASQPIEDIFNLCNIHDIVLVLDISGSIGDKDLTNTKYCDIQISSTGSPKIVNIENGGFITNITQKITFNKTLLKTLKADNITCAGIIEEIPNATRIYEKTLSANMYLKKILKNKLEKDSNHNIIHSEAKGINTIITTQSKSKSKKLAYTIRQQLNITKNKNIITTGPNYNRLKRPCVCIEIKNLDEKSLTQENMNKLADIIMESINEYQN